MMTISEKKPAVCQRCKTVFKSGVSDLSSKTDNSSRENALRLSDARVVFTKPDHERGGSLLDTIHIHITVLFLIVVLFSA